jgi:starch-binding outer membrane protein, SusD/RagB family
MNYTSLNKKTILAGLLSTALIFTVSCRKYLSPESLSTFDPSVVFSNIPNAQAAVNGAYLAMAGDFGYGIRVSYYYAHDDDIIMGGGSSLSSARHEEAHYTLQAGNTDIVNTFNQFYSGIERANNCIYYIPKMPQFTSGSDVEKLQLKRLLGESLVIRAQFFFDLIRIWGDVPAHWLPSAFEGNLFEKRTNRDTIYSHLLDDLAYAKTLMPWRKEVTQDERFTKGTAMALRAKIALFAGGYSLRQDGQMKRPANYIDFYKIARDECDTLMKTRTQHTLFPSFKSLWKDVVDAHKAVDASGELIMQVAMANGTNSDSKIGAQSGTKINGVGGSLGNMLPTYFYYFDSTDVRRDVTFVPFEVVRDLYGRGHASNSIYDGKFRRDWITSPSFYMSSGVTTGSNPVTLTPASNNNIQNFQLNWPLIRFADVLLMFAEAENEINGPTTEAINAWKEVSLRGHNGVASLVPTAPADKTGFFKLLVKERALEFGGEGIRKYDLIRWNLLNTALAETKANLLKFSTGTAMAAPSFMAAPPSYTLTANLPKQMWFYQNGLADNGSPAKAGSNIWVNSFYQPTPTYAEGAPRDSTQALDATGRYPLLTTANNRVNWFANANVKTTYVDYYAFGFVTGKSELYPIPQSSIDANGNLRPQNPNY